MITTCPVCRGGVSNADLITHTAAGWVHSCCASGDGPTRTGETVTNHLYWYVSVVDPDNSRRRGLLLGPYPSKDEAEAHVARGLKLACKANPWASFYAFGVASSNLSMPTVFGV